MTWLFFLAIFALSCALTFAVRRYAIAAHLYDHPNSRSAHIQPTPRGGGLAIVASSLVGMLVLVSLRLLDGPVALALVGGGALVGFVGLIDDFRSLSVRTRIIVHLVAASGAVYLLGGVPDIQVGDVVIGSSMLGAVLGVIGVVWSINFFNFMDGIDGIAGSQAVFVATAGGAISFFGLADSVVPACAMVIAAASLGFLLWNWPPAKIFMGDTGSGYLGFALAILVLAAMRTSSVAIFVWLILGAVFFVDATVTLLLRFIRGEKVYEAHSSHAYQILARRWSSHRRTTLAVQSINVFLLLPVACLASHFARVAWLLALLALTALTLAVLVVGAHRGSS